MRPRTSPSGIFASSVSGAGSAAQPAPEHTSRAAAANAALFIACRISAVAAVIAIAPRRPLPADRFHVGIDIGGGLRAEIHVIGMLVHVEHEDRPAAGKCGRMV